MVNKRVVLAVALASCLGLMWALQPQTRRWRIGWLAPGPRGVALARFLARARELGYVEGDNLAIEFREAASPQAASAAAADLVRRRVDLIVAHAPIALRAARGATGSIPIVTFFIVDPIRMGVTKSLARPDSNVTGFTWDAGVDTAVKMFEVVKELQPPVQRVALLWNLQNDSHPHYVKEFESLGGRFGLAVLAIGVRHADELDAAFHRTVEQKAGVAIVFTDPFTVEHRGRLTEAMARHPVAVLWGSAAWPLDGAVITFGANVSDQPREAADYVDRILKGAAPAELPFQQPTRFDLILDARAAQALGLRFSQALLLRADTVVGR
jgi:putative ABC transport system substrate-binding protein